MYLPTASTFLLVHRVYPRVHLQKSLGWPSESTDRIIPLSLPCLQRLRDWPCVFHGRKSDPLMCIRFSLLFSSSPASHPSWPRTIRDFDQTVISVFMHVNDGWE